MSVVSTHHYINHGGSELVVYRVTPEDVASGVLVGDVEYPGYPGAGVTVEGIRISDPAVRVAFFSLLHDQDLKTPIRVFARDEAGNSARADFDYRVFPKPFKRSRIELDDRFLDRVVPAILEGTTEVKPEGDTLAKFLAINGDLRRRNADKIASFAAQSAPELLWRGVVFHPFTNSSVESAFADHRTYVYKGKEVDQQIHLGFDLASFAGTRDRRREPRQGPVRGRARDLRQLRDRRSRHGRAVALRAPVVDRREGRADGGEGAATLGRSGMTGLAGGDHLHFTMLVNGQMVNPVEWWDAHWIEDRILRKLRTAGGATTLPVAQRSTIVRQGHASEQFARSGRARAGARWPRRAASRSRSERRLRTPSAWTPRKPDGCAGRVAIEGPIPENPPIKTGSDPYCARENKDGLSSETLRRSNNGQGLNNVFVYVKDGLGSYYFETPADRGEARSEGLPLHAARLRRAGGPADRDHQQRRDAPQRPRACRT